MGRKLSDIISSGSPTYNVLTITVAGNPLSAIRVRPIPQVPITEGLFIEYIQTPSSLVAGTGTPRLPLGFHSLLVDGATSYIADTVLNDTPKAMKFEKRFMERFNSLLNANQSFDEKSEDGRLEDRLYYLRNRYY